MSKDHPLVSIVTPSYNQCQFLEKTILSVLDQDYPSIEYIIIDDGSTDGSVEIIKKYERHLAYWESRPNRGQSDAINTGWKRAKGEILAYLNSDDVYMPGAVSTVVEYLSQHPEIAIVYGDCMMITEDDEEISIYRAKPFNYRKVLEKGINPILQPSAFIRREVLSRVGYLDPDLYAAMDWDFWLRSAMYYKFAYIQKCLSGYRLHHDSKSVNPAKRLKAASDYIRIYNKLLSHPDFPEDLCRKRRRLMSRAYFIAAQAYYSGMEFGKARKYMLKAMLLFPFTLGITQYLKLGLACLGPLGSYLLKRYYLRQVNLLLSPQSEVKDVDQY